MFVISQFFLARATAYQSRVKRAKNGPGTERRGSTTARASRCRKRIKKQVTPILATMLRKDAISQES